MAGALSCQKALDPLDPELEVAESSQGWERNPDLCKSSQCYQLISRLSGSKPLKCLRLNCTCSLCVSLLVSARVGVSVEPGADLHTLQTPSC